MTTEAGNEHTCSGIDVEKDLQLATEQVNTLTGSLKELDRKRSELLQQIQNLNGVAMYLRGKQSEE